MNDTPGWASPGSTPSDGQESSTAGPTEPTGAKPTGPDPKWSKEQAPPGQQSAPPTALGGPTPPPAGPGWGWGGQNPWPGHGGWGGPPPAAKPGVIPLRPLGVGEILDGAVSTMRAHWRTVLGISLAVAVFTQVIVLLLQGLVLNSSSMDALSDPDVTVEELSQALNSALSDSAVLLLFTLLGTILATALLTMVTSRAILGKPVTTGEAWWDARPQLPRLFGLSFLLPLMAVAITFIGALPGLLVVFLGSAGAGALLAVFGGLGASVVAIWLMFRFSLASPALILEKQSIRKALGRSAKLVQGSWWRVFGIQLLAAVIAWVVAAIVTLPATVVAGLVSSDGVSSLMNGADNVGWTFLVITGIGSVISSTLTLPISAGVTVLLYVDLRIRREALDLDLARAAGLPGYGAAAPDTTSGS